MDLSSFDFKKRKHDAIEELATLIQQMNYSEKVHCRHYLKTNGNKEHLQLFNFIDKEESLKAIQKRLNAIAGSNENKLARSITASLLAQLKPFHSKLDVENQLLDGLQELRYLAEKKLYKLCLKRLYKLKKKAYDYQNFEIVLRLNKLERELTFFSPKEISEKDKLLDEALQLGRIIRNETKARSRANTVSRIFFQTGLSTREKQESDLRELLQELEALSKNKDLSLAAISNIYQGISNIKIVQKKYAEAFAPFPLILEAFDAKPTVKKLQIRRFVQIVVNYINRMVSGGLCEKINDLDYINTVILNTKRDHKLTEDDIQYLDSTIAHAMYSIYSQNWQLDKALEQAEIMESCDLVTKRNKALYSIFNYELAQTHFYLGNYEKSHDYIDLFLNAESRKLFPDLYLFCRILLLFNFTEKGEKLAFFNHYEAIRKAVDSAPHQVHFEKLFMKMLLHYNKAMNKIVQQPVLLRFQEEFNKLETENPTGFMFFRTHKWLESKMG